MSGNVPAPFYEKAADIDCDGSVTFADVTRLGDLLSAGQSAVWCPDPELGDANWDGVVDATDAAVVRAHVAGQVPRPFHPQGADADCDGVVSSDDAGRIEAFASGSGTLDCPARARGDADGDGRITSTNAQFVAAQGQGLDPEVADANCDGVVNINDATLIVQVSVSNDYSSIQCDWLPHALVHGSIRRCGSPDRASGSVHLRAFGHSQSGRRVQDSASDSCLYPLSLQRAASHHRTDQRLVAVSGILHDASPAV